MIVLGVILCSLLMAAGVATPFAFDRHPADLIPGAVLVLTGIIIGCVIKGVHEFLLICLGYIGLVAAVFVTRLALWGHRSHCSVQSPESH